MQQHACLGQLSLQEVDLRRALGGSPAQLSNGSLCRPSRCTAACLRQLDASCSSAALGIVCCGAVQQLRHFPTAGLSSQLHTVLCQACWAASPLAFSIALGDCWRGEKTQAAAAGRQLMHAHVPGGTSLKQRGLNPSQVGQHVLQPSSCPSTPLQHCTGQAGGGSAASMQANPGLRVQSGPKP